MRRGVLVLLIGLASWSCAKTSVAPIGGVEPSEASPTEPVPSPGLGFVEGCWSSEVDPDSIVCWEPTRFTWDSLYITMQSTIVAARSDGDVVVYETEPGCTWSKATGQTTEVHFTPRPERAFRSGGDAIVLEADRNREYPLHRVRADAPPDVCSASARAERERGWDAFWTLVDRSREDGCGRDATSAKCCAEQSRRLEDRLSSLSAAEIVAFWSHLEQALNRAFTHELLGALRVVHGEPADGAFLELRLALVARGRAVFEATLVDPDGAAPTLASLATWRCPSFGSSPSRAHRHRTGTETPPADALPPSLDRSGSPLLGTPLANEDALSQRYPRLCKQFGGC